MRNSMERKQDSPGSAKKYKIPSITSSPIKHQIKNINIQDGDMEKSRANISLHSRGRERKEPGLVYDRKDRDLEEKKFEIFNAKGKFSCNCDVCMRHCNPANMDSPRKGDIAKKKSMVDVEEQGVFTILRGLNKIPQRA